MCSIIKERGYEGLISNSQAHLEQPKTKKALLEDDDASSHGIDVSVAHTSHSIGC